MKKSILFIIPSLGGGGAEKSLVTLLGLLDYKRFDVDLMLFRREGLFLEQVPEEVRVMDAGNEYKYFDGSLIRCLLYCLWHGKRSLALNRISYAFALRRKDGQNKNMHVWRYLSASLPKIEKIYDISVGYLEGNAVYYCVDKTTARKKIGYFHSDYSKLSMNKEFDSAYLAKLDSIATVSKSCAESLNALFPNCRGKIEVVENIISREKIIKLSVGAPLFPGDTNSVKILTVGRLSPEKGIDLAAEACEYLLKKGCNVYWLVVGAGELKDKIEMTLKEKGLDSRFVLAGQQKNPYGYMAQCDIYVQSSRYEGKAIAVEEAKALAKPIVVTRYSTVNDQIENNVTGIIAEIDAVSIADKIIMLINTPELASTLSSNLHKMHTGEQSGIETFNQLIGG